MQKIYPCLWFDTQAEDAVKFYTSLFEKSKIGSTARYDKASAEASGQPEGSTMTVEFELEDEDFLALNGGPIFKFTPGVSFYIHAKTETEINRLWAPLSKGGTVLWELQKYPWSDRYGWCEDKYGVSWQFILSDRKQKIAPCVLFTGRLFGKGEEAIHYYTSLFKNSKIETLNKDPENKSVLHSLFTLEGVDFVLMEGHTEKAREITPAISFVVNCKTQEEIDYYWDRLSQGGSTEQCGWLKDKYGVSWQITPAILGEMINSRDPAISEKVMKAMLGMTKLDIEKLKAAAR